MIKNGKGELRVGIERNIIIFVLALFTGCTAQKQIKVSETLLPSDINVLFKFDFGNGDGAAGYTKVGSDMMYTQKRGYGFVNDSTLAPVQSIERKGADALRSDFITSNSPFYFAVDVPEGNYRVTLIFGDEDAATMTTVKAELRRLMIENEQTEPGKFAIRTFIVNVRTPVITTGGEVKINDREKGLEFWAWDDKLTLEFNGARPAVCALEITAVDKTRVIYLLGDSTVCDQPIEPYNSWGQMLTRFFTPDVVIANHGESGESYHDSFSRRRIDKIMSEIMPGDYLLLQFGHNDMKQIGEEFGAFKNFRTEMITVIEETRKRGAVPVLITPMQRRNFDENGKVANSHRDYPDAVRQTAAEYNVPLIDLHKMSTDLYEAFGPDGSVVLFSKPKDGTHHNNYGSYQLAKCIVEGIKANKLEVAKYIVSNYQPYDPKYPDPLDEWDFPASPLVTNNPP